MFPAVPLGTNFSEIWIKIRKLQGKCIWKCRLRNVCRFLWATVDWCNRAWLTACNVAIFVLFDLIGATSHERQSISFFLSPHCLFNNVSRLATKKKHHYWSSRLGIPPQRASNAELMSKSWRHRIAIWIRSVCLYVHSCEWPSVLLGISYYMYIICKHSMNRMRYIDGLSTSVFVLFIYGVAHLFIHYPPMDL